MVGSLFGSFLLSVFIVLVVCYCLSSLDFQRRAWERPEAALGRQSSLLLSRESNTTVLDDSAEVRTNEILCKPMEEQNLRLTIGLSAVYPRDDILNGSIDAYIYIYICLDGCMDVCVYIYIYIYDLYVYIYIYI